MRVDEDEMRVGSSWRNPAIGRMEWLMIITLAVMLGGLLHDGARLLIANAVAKYHLEQFRAEQARQNEMRRQQQTASQFAQQRAQEAANQQRKLNSNDCRFWIQQNVISPSQRTADKVAIHCR
ncbi:hypothetical protein D3C78_828730 [compost metagenome]